MNACAKCPVLEGLMGDIFHLLLNWIRIVVIVIYLIYLSVLFGNV